MKKGFVFLLVLLFGISFIKAQFTVHKLLHAGYAYQNQSFGELGGRLLFLKTDGVVYRLGASAMMGNVNNKFAVMPKVQGDVLINFERNVDLLHSYYFLAGAEVTNKYITPKIGVSLFGLFDLTGGYAFSLDENGLNGKELQGLNINFTVNIPIVFLHDLLKK